MASPSLFHGFAAGGEDFAGTPELELDFSSAFAGTPELELDFSTALAGTPELELDFSSAFAGTPELDFAFFGIDLDLAPTPRRVISSPWQKPSDRNSSKNAAILCH